MSHYNRGFTRTEKDFNSSSNSKSDRAGDKYSGYAVKASTGRMQQGNDPSRHRNECINETRIKSSEFLTAKQLEEQAMMAVLGIRTAPPSAAASSSSTSYEKPTAKRESNLNSVKDEPMTPSIHNDPRRGNKQKQDRKHNRTQEDRRRRRQYQADGSDEGNHDWSDDDGLPGQSDEDNDEKHEKQIEPETMTEKELDEFLIDMVKNHGYKSIKNILKMKKKKKEKRKRSDSSSSSSSSASSESDDDKAGKSKKHGSRKKSHKKHSHDDEKKSSKRRHSSVSSSSPRIKERSKHHRR